MRIGKIKIFVHKFISKFRNIPTKYLIERGLMNYLDDIGIVNQTALVAYRYALLNNDIESIACYYLISRERVRQMLLKIARYA